MPRERIYTRTGDDGSTGLFYGGRVRKDSLQPDAYGTVDEAQAAMGMARAEARARGGDELDGVLVALERDLYVLMAELATLPANRGKLKLGTTAVSEPMVARLEALIDEYSARFEPLTEFVVPGGIKIAAALDLARTVVRRAERTAIAAEAAPGNSRPTEPESGTTRPDDAASGTTHPDDAASGTTRPDDAAPHVAPDTVAPDGAPGTGAPGTAVGPPGEDGVAHSSAAVRYLNRLSDLLWTLARWQEGDSLLAKDGEA